MFIQSGGRGSCRSTRNCSSLRTEGQTSRKRGGDCERSNKIGIADGVADRLCSAESG